MESQFQSKASIKSNLYPTTTFGLHQQPAIVKNIESLIFHQAKLEIGLVLNIDQRLKSSYDESKIQLKLELRRAYRLCWERNLDQEQKSQAEERINNILQKMRKLKEINLYFNDLKKQSGSLEADVQKFMFYIPKGGELQKKVLDFLSQPNVSQLILKQRQKNFNSNVFLAQIIEFYHFLQQNKLLVVHKAQENFRIRNQDLVLIQNSTLIFRQICQISDKYTLVQQQLQNSYVRLNFLRKQNQEEILSHKKYREQAQNIQIKIKQLNVIARKIRGNPAFAYQDIVVVPQEADIFEKLGKPFEYCFNERNQAFFEFLQEIYDGKQAQYPKINTGNFTFLRNKIIKAQMFWNLNKILSAFNIESHCVNQLHDQIVSKIKVYKFHHPSELIKYELNEKRISFYGERDPQKDQLSILTKNLVVVNKQEGYNLRRERSKVLYPSAILNYYYFLKYLLTLSTILMKKNLYNEELLLAITCIKANELNQWAQTALTFYDIVKNKYFTAYKPLQLYIQAAFSCKWDQDLEWIQKQVGGDSKAEAKLITYFSGKQQKAGWINQIIFQLDSNQDLTQPLMRLLQIELYHNQTAYCSDYPHFYELILNQIIQTRNNLKFDRCYSLNSLHQLFAFPGAHPDCLQVLAKQLAPLCADRLKLPQLLRFQVCQGKLKRQVFKAQLYWTNIVQSSVKSKFIFVSQRKKISFKDFLEQNAKYLLSILDQNLSFFITNIQEVERAVILFGQEVQRLKIIQSSILLLKPDFPLQDHLSAFNHKQLLGFFSYCSDFNFIEDIFIRRQKKNWVLNCIKRLISESRLKFGDLNMEFGTVTLKQILGGFIFFIYSFQHHLTRQDCIKLKKKVIGDLQPSQYHVKLQILRSKRQAVKQYQDSQFLQGQTLAQFVQIYELLIHITLNKILERTDIPLQDKRIMKTIRSSLPSYEPFLILQQLILQQFIDNITNSSSKAHSLASLRYLLLDFRQKRQAFKGYSRPWKTIEYLFMVPQIGIISRRIFCNQLIVLKNKVSGQQWKSFNKQNCLSKLRQIIDSELIQTINNFLLKQLNTDEFLNSHSNLTQNANLISQLCKKQIFQEYNQRYTFEEIQKRPIVLFDQPRGIQTDLKEQQLQITHTKYTKKGRANQKRGILNALTMEDTHTAILVNSLQQKVNLQIVKESLKMRKAIYRLQLEQKRIQDQIAWQTCKLEHNVVKKINNFIEQSTLDQKQSLINFKYTVNLQTIKGIENVIHQRTQIFGKKALEAQGNQNEEAGTFEKPQGGFVTQPKQKQAHQSQQSLLDINVRNIFNHVQKIKIFWAWKNMYLSKQSGEDQWKEFSLNVERILYNRQNMTKLNTLEEQRQKCGKNEIICNLIKQESNLLNNVVKNTKVTHLTQKLAEFKAKHSLEYQQNNR